MESSKSKPTVIAIVGPTGSGKTALSLSLAEALNAEIIACDSRTLYRHFNIGTAKPSSIELQRIRHHLIDVAEPDENYTVAQFCEQANEAIENMLRRGKQPLVCGGTGFYARALLEGLDIPAVAPQEELREQWRKDAEENGNAFLHEKLKQVDPVTAAKVNWNDRFRVIRALEVYHVSGKPMSEVARKSAPPFNTIWIGLTTNDRAELHKIIKERFAQQVQDGILDETRRLYERYGASQKLLHTVNYKQLTQHIEGQLDLQSAFDAAIIHNNQLARKQLMWFRSNPQTQWFEVDRLTKDELKNAVSNYIKGTHLLERT